MVDVRQAEELAEHLYVHSHFHDGEPNPTAQLMREGAAMIRLLLEAAKKATGRDVDPNNFGIML